MGCGGRGWVDVSEVDDETTACADVCTTHQDKVVKLLVWFEDQGDQSVEFPLNEDGLVESTFAALSSKLRFFADNGEVTVKSVKLKYTGDRLADISSVWLYTSFQEESVYCQPASVVGGEYIFQPDLVVKEEESNYLDLLVYFLAPPSSVSNRHSFEISGTQDILTHGGVVEGGFPLKTPSLILGLED
jgi:hypothetical protein